MIITAQWMLYAFLQQGSSLWSNTHSLNDISVPASQ